MTQDHAVTLKTKEDDAWKDLTQNNAKMHQWFIGKCLHDKKWCLWYSYRLKNLKLSCNKLFNCYVFSWRNCENLIWLIWFRTLNCQTMPFSTVIKIKICWNIWIKSVFCLHFILILSRFFSRFVPYFFKMVGMCNNLWIENFTSGYWKTFVGCAQLQFL